MLLMTTSIVGAESPGAIDSKPGCSSDSPGNGKGKANGHNKNCKNESDSPPEDPGSDPAPSSGSNLTNQNESGHSQAPDELPNWSDDDDPENSGESGTFTTDTYQPNVAPDCFIDRGRGLNRGSDERCERGARTFTEVEKHLLLVRVEVACIGEWITVSGTFHFLSHTTLDANGGFHSKGQINPTRVYGFGETSGIVYRGTGVTQWQNDGIVGAPQTYINNFMLIGHGSAPNLLVHQNVHTTTNANGDVTSNIDHTTITCK